MTKHPKRPRDPAQLAKLIVDIATGEVKEILASESAAAKLGRSGGLKGALATAGMGGNPTAVDLTLPRAPPGPPGSP